VISTRSVILWDLTHSSVGMVLESADGAPRQLRDETGPPGFLNSEDLVPPTIAQ
jgi:hypothetical protein